MNFSKSRAIKRLPCPKCPSSDGYTLYDDGHYHCFVCGHNTQPEKGQEQEEMAETQNVVAIPKVPETIEYLPHRGLTRHTCEFYGIRTYVGPAGEPTRTAFPWSNGATQFRGWADNKPQRDKTYSEGPMSKPGCFGVDKFPAGSAQAITITEGAYDAATVFQVLGSKYPSISVKSASTALADVRADFDYINSFDKIYLAFDNDEPGRKAARQAASCFDFNKVYEVPLDKELKDANGYLQAGKADDLRRAWWNSKRYLPEGIVSSYVDFDRIIDEAESRPTFPYPYGLLQSMLRGISPSEFVLVTAMEGVGKTEFLRSIEYHTLTTTDHRIGCVHIEEPTHDQLKRLSSYHLNVPAHLRESNVSNEEIKAAVRKITKSEDRLQLYSHFGSDDPDILLDTIRFMVAVSGCKIVFLDHITMVVTGLADEDERKTLDYLSTKLATMVNDLDFTLFCVSHVNDDGRTRGSRNISKVADTWLHLSRDLENPDEFERNKMFVTVKKNRRAGTTGPGGVLLFDTDTHKLGEAPQAVEVVPVG